MKVYIAAPWIHKGDAKTVGEECRKAGLEVVSRWHDTTHSSNIYEAPQPVMEAEALKDWDDISKAEGVLYLNLAKSEGKATELGIALTRGIPVFVVGGTIGNVFLHLPQVNHVPDVEVGIVELLEHEG